MSLGTLNEFLRLHKNNLEAYMNEQIEEIQGPSVLKEAMLYSLSAGGKRIRPALLFATLEAFGKDTKVGLPIAAALEMVHTYSLIHDDLPCMDDDDLRRGKPTNHIVFGEANAVLAGDALLTHAFLMITKAKEQIQSDILLAIVEEFAQAAGPEGMIAGQVLDMEAEGKVITIKQLEEIHRNKTGRLLVFPLVAAGLLAGATKEQVEQLREVGYLIGLAFQIQDDILDVEGTESEIGKPVGSDISNEKSTYTTLYSLGEAKMILKNTVEQAKEKIQLIGIDATYLLNLCDVIMTRKN
ncbi:MAG: polyprenyl synthetase family protein [Bacillaceae bacterium]